MKVFLALFFLFSVLNCNSQNEYISIGKRKNVIWGRKIDSTNLGSMYSYYYPIFFKVDNNEYTKAGVYGKHLYPHLNYSINQVNTEFYKFRKNKILSHILLGSSISFLSIWAYRGAKYLVITNDNNLVNMYFKNNQYIFILSYAFSISTSIYFNIRGDKKLINAVKFHNKGVEKI